MEFLEIMIFYNIYISFLGFLFLYKIRSLFWEQYILVYFVPHEQILNIKCQLQFQRPSQPAPKRGVGLDPCPPNIYLFQSPTFPSVVCCLRSYHQARKQQGQDKSQPPGLWDQETPGATQLGVKSFDSLWAAYSSDLAPLALSHQFTALGFSCPLKEASKHFSFLVGANF